MASVLENGVYRIQPLHSRDKCLVLGQPSLDGAPQVILGRNSLHPLQEELWLVTRGENHTFVVSSMTLRKGYIDDVGGKLFVQHAGEAPVFWEFEVVETTDPELYFRISHPHSRKVWKIPAEGHPQVQVADSAKAKSEVWAFVRVPEGISDNVGERDPRTAAAPKTD